MKEAMEAFLAQFDTNGEDGDQMSEVGSERQRRGQNILTILTNETVLSHGSSVIGLTICAV